MSSRSPEHWSLNRSLAFLAATFAIMVATLLPSAVAASAATGAPIMLCSGERIFATVGDDGAQPDKRSPTDSLKCADCVLAALTALSPPPSAAIAPAPRKIAIHPAPARTSAPPPPRPARSTPPATAPPAA